MAAGYAISRRFNHKENAHNSANPLSRTPWSQRPIQTGPLGVTRGRYPKLRNTVDGDHDVATGRSSTGRLIAFIDA